MSNRTASVTCLILGAAVSLLVPGLHSRNAMAQVQGLMPGFVKLQPSTPGTPDNGHANISGTMIANQFVGGGTALTGLSANNVTNGLLGTAFGGTGLNTVSTPTGSLLRTVGLGTWGTLPAGSEGQALKVAGGAPQWGIDSLTLPYSVSFTGFIGMSLTDTGNNDVIDATINNGSSNAECFQGVSNGSGDVVQGTMSGNGRAATFQIANSSSTNSAVFTASNGTGAALQATMTGTGTAALFQSSTSGTSVDVCGPNGAVHTVGMYYRDYSVGQRSAAVPIAYGSVSSTGVVQGGTGNFTVNHTVAGDYDVTVTGETYSNTGYMVTILPISNSPRMTTIADAGTPFIVHVFDMTGTKIDTGFQFTVWRADAGG